MKRLRFLIPLSLLLLVLCLLTSCETTALGTGLTGVMYGSAPAETDRYLIWEGHWGTVLVDKESGAVYPLDGGKDPRLEGMSHGGYVFSDGYLIAQNGVEWRTYLSVPTYDSATGAVDHYDYYPTTLFFSFTGELLSRTTADTPLTEREAKTLEEREFTAMQDRFTFAQVEGSGRDRYEEREGKPAYTENQEKAVAFATSLEKNKRGEFHAMWGEGLEQDGKVYFSVMRSNQKNWSSQAATVEGIYHAGVFCYDPATDAVETLLSVGGRKEILLFDTTHALVRSGDTIVSIPYDGGDAVEVYALDGGDYLFETADGLLHLYRIATVKGTPPDAVGYSRFSYPCTFHVFITPDGRILAEDLDLTAEQKEYVTNGSDVSFD